MMMCWCACMRGCSRRKRMVVNKNMIGLKVRETLGMEMVIIYRQEWRQWSHYTKWIHKKIMSIEKCKASKVKKNY